MQGRGNWEGFDYNDFAGGGRFLAPLPLSWWCSESGSERGGRALGLMDILCRERTGQIGRATCTAQVRPDCWAEQSVAPETVPGPGRQRQVDH